MQMYACRWGWLQMSQRARGGIPHLFVCQISRRTNRTQILTPLDLTGDSSSYTFSQKSVCSSQRRNLFPPLLSFVLKMSYQDQSAEFFFSPSGLMQNNELIGWMPCRSKASSRYTCGKEHKVSVSQSANLQNPGEKCFEHPPLLAVL